jgi:TonB family protein
MPNAAVAASLERMGKRAPGGERGRQAPLSFALGFSLLLHVALVLVLILHQASKGVLHPVPRRVVMEISLDSLRDPGKAPTPAVQMPPVQEQPKPKLQPVPVPPVAQAAPKKVVPPKQPQHTVATAQPHPPQAAPTPAQARAATPVQKQGEEGESFGLTLLGRVRENWLRPVSSAATFRCRLRIDYLAGGTITNVVILEGCGNNPLDDSVQRAVWKTQPLPLGPSQNGPGSLVLDFTP